MWRRANADTCPEQRKGTREGLSCWEASPAHLEACLCVCTCVCMAGALLMHVRVHVAFLTVTFPGREDTFCWMAGPRGPTKVTNTGHSARCLP